MKPFTEEKIFTPGPTPVPLAAKLKTLNGDLYHRSGVFCSKFLNCRKLLRSFFLLPASAPDPLVLPVNATGAMESLLLHFTNPEDEVLVISGGRFGRRWVEIAERFQCRVKVVHIAFTENLDFSAFEALLKNSPKLRGVFCQSVETSTGKLFPIQRIGELVNKYSGGALFVVDAVASIGLHKIDSEAWGIDAVLASGQKSFGVPPGVSFIALNNKAWERAFVNNRPRFFIDLPKELEKQNTGNTRWTSPTSLVEILEANLIHIHELGLEPFEIHHRQVATSLRHGLQSMGMQLLLEDGFSNGVTVFYCPDAPKVLKHLQTEYGCVFSGGKEELQDKVIRFGHMGLIDIFHILRGLAALEWALADLKIISEVGIGVTAFMKSIQKYSMDKGNLGSPGRTANCCS